MGTFSNSCQKEIGGNFMQKFNHRGDLLN